MSRHAAVYARISHDPNATHLGTARQVNDCRDLAAKRGWTVVEPFVDDDTSATSGRARPRYEAMLAALRAGRCDALVVWDVDRLTRTPRELEDIIDLADKHGVALASVGGDIDLATPQGQLTARIKGNVARHEADQLSRRVRRKMSERAEAGQPHGRVPFGWRREYQHDQNGRVIGSRDVVDAGAAQVVQEAAESVLAGDSLRSIVARLTASSAPTPTGKPWTTTVLRGVLLRERNAGLRVHQGQVIGRGNWPPLLDESTWERVKAVLTDPARRTSPASSAIKYLLSGIARCDVCSGPMRVLTVGKDGRKQDSYVCQTGYHVRRQRQALEDLVEDIVIQWLSQPGAADLFTRRDDGAAREAREQADAVRARLDLAADSYAAGDIDARQLTRITSRLRPELEKHEQAARDLSTAPDLLDLASPDIARLWRKESDPDGPGVALARKRAVIDLLMEIRVKRNTRRGGQAATFDSTSVTITPRQDPAHGPDQLQVQ